MLKLSYLKQSHWTRSNKRTKNKNSSGNPITKDNKWASESRDEQLTHAAYVELGEDGRSDQNYAMKGIEVTTDINLSTKPRD